MHHCKTNSTSQIKFCVLVISQQYAQKRGNMANVLNILAMLCVCVCVCVCACLCNVQFMSQRFMDCNHPLIYQHRSSTLEQSSQLSTKSTRMQKSFPSHEGFYYRMIDVHYFKKYMDGCYCISGLDTQSLNTSLISCLTHHTSQHIVCLASQLASYHLLCTSIVKTLVLAVIELKDHKFMTLAIYF